MVENLPCEFRSFHYLGRNRIPYSAGSSSTQGDDDEPAFTIQHVHDSRRYHAVAAQPGNPGAGVLAAIPRAAGAQPRLLRVRAGAGPRDKGRQNAVPDPTAAFPSELAPPHDALIP